MGNDTREGRTPNNLRTPSQSRQRQTKLITFDVVGNLDSVGKRSDRRVFGGGPIAQELKYLMYALASKTRQQNEGVLPVFNLEDPMGFDHQPTHPLHFRDEHRAKEFRQTRTKMDALLSCLFPLFLIVLLPQNPLAAGEQVKHPNIVYIIADDHAWTDFGFMGNARVHTPNLDALAASSARFTCGYVPSSVCRPSLASLLTGLYPHQHGIHFNHGPPGNAGYNRMTAVDDYVTTREREFTLIRKHKTLPAILHKEAGYRCFQTGKFWEGHWGNGGFTEGMTIFQAPPANQLFGGRRQLASGEHVAHGNGDTGLQIGRETMQPIFDFMNDCWATESPWFVWYAPYLPHQPHDSPKQFYDLARSKPNVKNYELPYFASIAQFDASIGQLIQHVNDNGQLENTAFVFLSDNGWRPSSIPQRNRPVEFAHTARSKRAPFDDGLRTPILIRWDGVITPASFECPVSSIDLMPTLLALAGIERNQWPQIPGMDLFPVCLGQMEPDADRPIFGEIYPGDATSLNNPSADVAYRWIRQANLKLIEPHRRAGQSKPWGGHLQTTALFDVESDPFEQRDLSSLPEHQLNMTRLRAQLDQWWKPESRNALNEPANRR